MLTGTQIKKIRGRKWNTDFSLTEVLTIFDKQGPLKGIISASELCLTWLVEKIFNNRQGKPLKLAPFQSVLLDMLWCKKFPLVLGSRGCGKTFMLALYALLRALLVPGSKIVICGAGYRQAKLVFKYIDELYEGSPIVKEAIRHWGGPKYGSDGAWIRVGSSSITAIPIGDGEKIRGLRATVLICDEFASIPEEIFEIVISPFTAVHSNPAERAMVKQFQDRIKSLGAPDQLVDAIEQTQGFGNQIVISGTAYYRHNHFYKRYELYRSYIESKGDAKKLKMALEQSSMARSGQVSDIDTEDVERLCKIWRQYAIFQMPYTGLPPGFLDEDTIRSDKAKFPRHRFLMEYMAQFPQDSDGFIKRSQIDFATPKEPEEIPVPVELYGDPRATYVMGLDPARENDNFGCVVLKLTDRGKEVVYCTAWDKTKFYDSSKNIREICNRFNIEYIAMDSGGGGTSVIEWLYKKQKDVDESDLLWPIPEQLEKYASRDALGAPGRKIVELVNFSPTWTAEAAHNLAAAVEQRNLLFPYKGDLDDVINQYQRHFDETRVTDAAKEMLAKDLWGVDEWEAQKDKESARMGIHQHIQECTNEVCAIVRTVTPGGVEHFSLPRLSDQPEGMDMRRKDRFSALMLANYAAKVYLGHGHRKKNRPGMTPEKKYSKTRTQKNFRRKGSVLY